MGGTCNYEQATPEVCSTFSMKPVIPQVTFCSLFTLLRHPSRYGKN